MLTRRSTRWMAPAALLALVAAACAPNPGPSPVRRDPVVIVAGTYATGPIADVAYAVMAARLRGDGYDVTVFDLPGLGLGDLRDTAAELGDEVRDVLARTGAGRVDLVGHSQGGVVSRWYVERLGGDSTVDALVSLAAPHHGSVAANLAALLLGLGSCIGSLACIQMSVGSEFLADLNEGDDSVGDVRYTNLVTSLDEIVIPYTSGLMDPADGNITNLVVQEQCPLRPVAHLTMATDGAVYSGILDALREQPLTLDCFVL